MMGRSDGFTLLEMMVAATVSLMMFLIVFSVYQLGNEIKDKSRSDVEIHANVRAAMDRMERETRMIGFGVPSGAEIGGTAVWSPSLFYASATGMGFRAEIDGGIAEITCTPDSSNGNCPRNKLRLDTVDYHNGFGCQSPDGSGGNMALIAVLDRTDWQRLTCTAVDTANAIVSTSDVTNQVFSAGSSQLLTMEQVYYRYVAQAQPPYGYLARYVRYANSPDNTFPPNGVTWTTVADHLTDFWVEYKDAAGTVLNSTPLSAADRAAVSSIIIYMEGYDQTSGEGNPRLLQARSEIVVRNGV